MWYSFTANTSSLVLDFIQTNITNCYPYYIVYGPYTSVTAGCNTILSPTIPCSANGGTVLATAQPTNHVSGPAGGMYWNLLSGDPGNYTLLTGLNTTPGNNTYLIQLVNGNCSGPYSSWATFCIGIYPPAANTNASGASAINSCGTQYAGSSSGGYYPTDNGANLDNNSSTTCGGCTAGSDVPYVINNPSYFTFCAASNGTYNVSFDVTSCVNSTLTGATGAQMSILIGSTTSMTNIANAPNPVLVSTAVWTSPNFSLAAGQCAFLVVDGFAGDACNYTYTLNNVGGGCLLPIELLNFSVDNNQDYNKIYWTTATEINNAYFTLEKSTDGVKFEALAQIAGAGNSNIQRYYEYFDTSPFEDITYYQLSQTDYDGTTKKLGIISVKKAKKLSGITLRPNPASNTTYLEIPSDKEDVVTIQIVDLTGRSVSSQEISLKPGKNTFEVHTSGLEKGIYFIHIHNRSIDKSFKLLKRIKIV